ncbi:hypothetical protein ACE38W_14495 [Chitinophaga sp. Hz27]|uniref:hypothetical protein n=1 Tax=Chitinophaga sp. Hz27 TaxID=3347169 RepID=UPI0035DF3923
MAHALTYRISFQDRHPVLPANWEIQLLRKNATNPTIIELPAGQAPIIIDKGNSDANTFGPIIGTSATITYTYDIGLPHPNVFIKGVEEDTWMMIILKNGVREFTGFVVPDSNTYPLLHPPYDFQINATDYFQGLKGTTVNLDDDVLFLYDYITWGAFFKRVLFDSLPYDDAVVNLVFSRRPAILSDAATLANALYIHTDILYDFDKGPLFAYDALKNFLLSTGCRIFYSAGAYWVMRIEDMDQTSFTYLQITPDNLDGEVMTDGDTIRYLGTSDPQNDVYYTGRTQRVRVDPALKQQSFIYKLKGINRLTNFDWRDYSVDYFPGWHKPNPGLVLSRYGSGTISDPYKARFSGSGDMSSGQFIWQQFIVKPGQRVELNIKGLIYYTSGIRVAVYIQPLIGGKQYFLSGSEWREGSTPAEDQEIIIAPNSKTNQGSLSITTSPIPSGSGSFYLYLSLPGPKPGDDPVPPGTVIYNEVYPVFLRIYNDTYVEIDTQISNNGVYSYIPDDLEVTFLDTNDNALSNTIYYKEGSDYKPITKDGWVSIKDSTLAAKPIEELMARDRLAAAHIPVENIEGNVLANTLRFHHVVECADINERLMVVRDKYNVLQCLHDVLLVTIMPEGSGDGIYSVTQKTAEE